MKFVSINEGQEVEKLPLSGTSLPKKKGSARNTRHGRGGQIIFKPKQAHSVQWDAELIAGLLVSVFLNFFYRVVDQPPLLRTWKNKPQKLQAGKVSSASSAVDLQRDEL